MGLEQEMLTSPFDLECPWHNSGTDCCCLHHEDYSIELDPELCPGDDIPEHLLKFNTEGK